MNIHVAKDEIRCEQFPSKRIVNLVIHPKTWTFQNLFDDIFDHECKPEEVNIVHLGEELYFCATALVSLRKCQESIKKFTLIGLPKLRMLDKFMFYECKFKKLEYLYLPSPISFINAPALKYLIVDKVDEVNVTGLKLLRINSLCPNLRMSGDFESLKHLEMICCSENYSEFQRIISKTRLEVLKIKMVSSCVQYEVILENHPTICEVYIENLVRPKKEFVKFKASKLKVIEHKGFI